MEIMTQAWSLGVTALSSLLPCLPSLKGPRRQKDARHLFPGQGEMVTKNDEHRGRSRVSLVWPGWRWRHFYEGFVPWGPTFLETEAIFSPRFCDSAGQLFQASM